MLKAVKRRAAPANEARFAIVASRYNSRYVDAMVREARRVLIQNKAADVQVIRVPGAFEIPAVAAYLAAEAEQSISAILCLGVILRGETTHAQHIGEAISQALAQIQIQHRVPVIHEVLLLESGAQAAARCLDKKSNRGAEAAYTALEMMRVMKSLRQQSEFSLAEFLNKARRRRAALAGKAAQSGG